LFIRYDVNSFFSQMTRGVDDSHFPKTTIDSPLEYVAFIFLISYMVLLLHFLVKTIRGNWIDLKNATGKFSIAILALLVIWQIFVFILLYVDSPKIVSLLYTLFGQTVGLVFMLGLCHFLKGFCKNSSFITIKRIKYTQILFCGLYVVLIGPHWYLFGFINSTNPPSFPVH
jgi:membrane protein CcdC involved in cytochrome C biogenesis